MKKYLLILFAVFLAAGLLGVVYFGVYLPLQEKQLREQWASDPRFQTTFEQLEKAEELLAKAKTDKEKFTALSEIAFRYYGLQEYERAVKYWQKAEPLAPDPSLTHYNIGNAYKNLGDYARAEEFYKKALSGKGGGFRLAVRALDELYWQRMPEKKGDLVAIYKQAIAKDPGNVNFLSGLAYHYKRMEEWGLALEYYKQAAEIKPDFEPYQKEIAELSSLLE